MLECRDRHRNAIEHGVARQRIHPTLIGQIVGTDASMADGRLLAHALPMMAPTMRNADHPGHDILGDFHRQMHLADPRSHTDFLATFQPDALGI
ncbi:hypothetical protein RZS08_03725, partial [Arthrospira platensis SPKY1]|nr:hypothetical protein [Arthrospira platensis SPKY1]